MPMTMGNIKEFNTSEVESKIQSVISEGLKEINRVQALKTILSFIELTSLEGSDTDEKVVNLCRKAYSFKDKGEDIPNVASVCVYPVFVKLAKEQLKGRNIKVVSVAGAFPGGQSPLSVKLSEVKYALGEGADEIDMVMSRGKFLEGKYSVVSDEIAEIKAVCKATPLKVILETGELGSLSNISKASEIAIEAGCDFIKTSTGKIKPGATEQAFFVMLDAIKEHYEKTEKMTGIKPAGGISEPQQALNYFIMVSNILGDKWIDKKLFRFGASKLADALLSEIL